MSAAVATMTEELTAAYRLLRDASEDIRRAAGLMDRYSPSLSDQAFATLSLLDDSTTRLGRAIRQLESQ
jgi:hypothetical protein